MASTHLTSADDSSSSRSSSTKETEQKDSAAQPQKPTVVSAVTSLEQQPPPTAASSNGAEGGKRTLSTSANSNDADDAGASADAKRHRPNDKDDEVKNDKTEDDKNEQVLDFARTLGLVDGDRLQVKWEIVQDNDDDDNDNDENADSTTTTTTTTHWWTATLLPHDGRVVDENVAIRTLDYDPYPDAGFPERSMEDVVFLGPDLLVDPVTRDDLRFRRLGETHDIDDDDEDNDEEETDNINIYIDNREDLERIVNETLANALANQAAKWQSLSVAQQAHIASTVAEKKEVLLTLLGQHQGVITAPIMQQLLAQAMSMPSSTSTTTSTTSSSHHY